ncbi:MAG: DUF1109 domain-containing protein [Gemmatimonadetes bacterium]|nr:DUF1109 domain-containing protein [Gemmatimonadota bacterium]
MDTDRLIHALSNELTPVTPLAHPWRRTLAWTAGAAAYLALMVFVTTPREDVGARLRDPLFMLEQVAALVTGLTAAWTALASAVPGRRPPVALPFAAAAVWLALVVAGAVRDARLAADGTALFQADWGCVGTVVAGTIGPAAVMTVMLRRAAALTPRLTAALGGLGAAGLGNLGSCLSHPDASNVIVLVWHVGTVMAVAMLAGVLGPRFLHWPRTVAVQP